MNALERARATLDDYRREHPDPDGECLGECAIDLSAALRDLVAWAEAEEEVRSVERLTASEEFEALRAVVKAHAYQPVAYATQMILAAGFHRRGPVADEMVLAGLNAEVGAASAAPDLTYYGEVNIARMRAALEAAEAVR